MYNYDDKISHSLKDAFEGNPWAYYNIYGEKPNKDDW